MLKISLDAGHGINTPGKRVPDDSLREWSFNSAVVGYIQEELAHYKDVAVLRVDDPTGKRDVPLKERTDRVNGWGSNVHLSIHANASSDVWSDANGLETFVYKTTLKEAVALADCVQKNIVQATGLRNRGVKEGNLHMIRETHMTAILVEGPFMSNRTEAELLKSDTFRRIYAHAIVTALVERYKLVISTPITSVKAAKEGWALEGGKWYFYKNGALLKNDWAQDSKKLWYFLGKDGVMVASDWIQWKNKWYYLKADGSMATGTIEDKGKLYYLQSDGSMVENTRINVTLNVDKSGVLKP